jgi:hypothetical protein
MAYWGVEVYIHAFLTSALDGGEWSASRPGSFTPRERAPGTHWIGGWVGPEVGLDTVVKRKFPVPARTRAPDIPARSTVPELYHCAIPAQMMMMMMMICILVNELDCWLGSGQRSMERTSFLSSFCFLFYECWQFMRYAFKYSALCPVRGDAVRSCWPPL